MIIDDAPFFDLLQRSKAAEAGEVIVQAAISYARGLTGDVDITHWRKVQLRGSEFEHTGEGESGQCITRTVIWVEARLLMERTGGACRPLYDIQTLIQAAT